jgi:NTP pyrophosphatase (non-canonical NTP hydrolase)
MTEYEYAAIEIAEEIKRARAKHAPMRGAHEGYAVLLEEVDELWDEVKRRAPDLAAMRKEAIQIGAMALAFVVEVCDRAAPATNESANSAKTREG